MEVKMLTLEFPVHGSVDDVQKALKVMNRGKPGDGLNINLIIYLGDFIHKKN